MAWQSLKVKSFLHLLFSLTCYPEVILLQGSFFSVLFCFCSVPWLNQCSCEKVSFWYPLVCNGFFKAHIQDFHSALVLSPSPLENQFQATHLCLASKGSSYKHEWCCSVNMALPSFKAGAACWWHSRFCNPQTSSNCPWAVAIFQWLFCYINGHFTSFMPIQYIVLLCLGCRFL